AGFYVRGGGPDQNLILLDDAVVYNTRHLFGFFASLNSDAIKNVLNSDLTTIMQTNVTLENKRKAFHHFSENFYNFLRNIKYDAAKVYLHECTMPFNDTGRAVWLSKSDTLRNPYLGMYHPRYGSGMLECGTEEATIDYTANEK
ncbi:MAG: hypothetical protein ACXWCZ_08760, partial [Flavisolibacter sp.]